MSRPGQFYPDGYCGGAELPDSLDIDRMVYPERQKPVEVPFNFGSSFDDYQSRQIEAQNKQAHENYERDRKLEITIGAATGQQPGPPRTIGRTSTYKEESDE